MGFSGDLRRGAVVVAITLAVMGLVASVTGANSVDIGGVSAVMWCAAISLGIQWLAWIPASLKRTERFYDLVGGLTYIAVIIFSLWAGSQSEPPGPRELIVSVLVVILSLIHI